MCAVDTEKEYLFQFVRNTEEIERIGRLKKVDADTSLEYILERSARTHELYSENVTLYSKWIQPLLENIEQCSPSMIQSLFQFAQALQNKEYRLDREMSFSTHKALLRYARKTGDRDLLIQELYYCGMGYYEYMNDKMTGTFGNEQKKPYRNEYFFEGAGYLEHWEEITNSQTMDYAIRCCGNRALGYVREETPEEQNKLCCEALEIVNRKELQDAFPDLPWDLYALTIHMNITTRLGYLSGKKYSPDIMQSVVASARIIMQQNHQNPSSALRWKYFYTLALYSNEEISVQEFLQELQRLYGARNRTDYSASGILLNVKLPFIYLEYLMNSRKELPEEDRAGLDEYMKRVEPEIVKDFFDYCARFQSDGMEAYLIREICYIIDVLSSLSDVTAEDLLVNLVMQRHIPTYIHSEMVSCLAVLLAERLLDKDPMRFAGLLGVDSPEEVLARREKVLLTVKQAGFFHDIGKLMCLETISVYNRRLFPEEFDIIKAHPYNGYRLLQKSPSTALYAQAALLHHWSYDGTKGYPKLPQDFVRDPKLDVLTDLVTVADLLDAATDTIGRSYSPGVDLEQLILEYRVGYDTRYAGYVVDLFDDPELVNELETMIDSGRLELYRKSYLYFMKKTDESSAQDENG